MLNVIMTGMKKEYLQKINCYNLYNPTLSANPNDVEYNNKLLNTSYDQMLMLVSNAGNGIFSADVDVQPIDVFLDDGRTLTLCTIDNFRIRLEIINEFQCIIIDIGTQQYKISFLKNTLDNAASIIIMKENFSVLKNAIHAVTLNQKLILYWLNVLKEHIKQ